MNCSSNYSYSCNVLIDSELYVSYHYYHCATETCCPLSNNSMRAERVPKKILNAKNFYCDHMTDSIKQANSQWASKALECESAIC